MAPTGTTAAARRRRDREPHCSAGEDTLPQAHRVEEIFCAALELQPAELLAFLDRACAGDIELRRKVEGLLGARREQTPSVLQTRGLPMPALLELDRCLRESSPAPSSQHHGRDVARGFVSDSVIGGYRLISELGKGGTGEVHLGVHELTGERVAIKTMRAEQAEQGEALARFFAEATAASRIDHPGIVRVHGHGRSATGRAYIVMEYLEGESLRERLHREDQLPIATAVDIARQIAAALAAAHAKGIIHRDLTPGNIFLSAGEHGRDHVKLLDFGIAKIMDAPLDGRCATPSGTILGTPTYMSPEQCQGAPHVDHRTDLYALGCVMFAMLCGRPPFTSTRFASLLAAHLSKPPPRPSALRAAIPAWLDHVVLRLLAKDRDQRYGRAADVLDALSVIDTGAEHALDGPCGGPAGAHELSLTLAQGEAPRAALARCSASSVTTRATARTVRDEGETVRAWSGRRAARVEDAARRLSRHLPSNVDLLIS